MTPHEIPEAAAARKAEAEAKLREIEATIAARTNAAINRAKVNGSANGHIQPPPPDHPNGNGHDLKAQTLKALRGELDDVPAEEFQQDPAEFEKTFGHPQPSPDAEDPEDDDGGPKASDYDSVFDDDTMANAEPAAAKCGDDTDAGYMPPGNGAATVERSGAEIKISFKPWRSHTNRKHWCRSWAMKPAAALGARPAGRYDNGGAATKHLSSSASCAARGYTSCSRRQDW
jgi:hypothetical protein